jgi:hypothetical protein
MAKTQAEVRAAKDAKLGINRNIQTTKNTTKYDSAPSNIEELHDRKDAVLGITRREGSTWNTGKTYTKPTAQSLLDQYNASAKKRIEEANAATQKAKKEYDDYIAKEGRIYQKNYGAPSDKANELQNKLNQARLAQRDAENEATITRLAQTSTLYKDNKNKKSKVDISRTTELSTGIRAKEGNLTWDTDTYKAMTDEEASVYNRLAKNGKEKEAEAFLKAITPTLNARVTQNRLESAQKTAQDGVMGGVGASIASSLLKPVTAAQGGIQTVYNFLTGKPIDTNAPEYYASNLANTLRSSVAEKIENGVYESTKGDYTYDRTGTRRMTTEGEAKNNGKIASFLYQTGMSMADMLTMTPFGPVGMQVMMSSNAGVDTMIDAKNNGATDDQAMALGIVSGAAEALFEKFSIENLFHGGVSKSTILAALKQGGIEASEEMATEITNILANEAVMGNQSDFNKAVAEYKAIGLDDKDAKAKALEEKLLQVLEAGAGGFLSGFGMGAAADVMNTQSAGAALINDYANTIAEDMDINTYLEQGMSETEANRARLADAKKQAIQELSAELQSEGAELEKGTVANRLSNKAYTSESGIGRQFLANTEGMRLSSGKRADTDNDLTNVTPATREAAKSLDMLDKSNIARYINEITAALDRSAATGKKILIGKPSGILAEQMNSDNVLQMDQSVARKVAFADKKDGGKHNLGRGVLDELPYQLADPMIITGNTTDHISKGDTNSVVVWTDWQTENGGSVIVPIRIDVDGAIEPYNSVNSVFDAYNPAYVADLLRDENIRYTRNNKSVEELLSNRRQVPAATRSVDASDTEGLLSNGREVPAATRTSDVNNTVSQESVRVKEYLANLRKPTAQETLAAVADDPTKAEEQLSLSEKEQNFAKNLSQAAQNLNMVNAETKALGREYYTHSEEMPSLQDIQKKNIEDFTSEDFSVLAKNLLGSGKQRLYTKEPSRVFDTVAGNNKALRNTLYNLFEKPFNEAGGNYGKSLTSSVESYKEIMRKYDIKPKSKEDIAAQRYGEGQYQGPDGEMIEYTLTDLQRDCPDTWENVKGFAEANRRVYEDYLNRINSMMETIYPNILENAEEEYQTAVSRRDVAQSKVDAMTRAITEKQNRIQRLQDTRNNKQRTDTKAFAKIEGSIATEQAKVDSMKTELVQLEKKLRVAEMNVQARRAAIDSGAIYEGKRIIPRKDYFHHAQEMLSDYSVLDFLRPKNVTEDVSPALAGVSDQTKPKTRWWGAMFHRGRGPYFESASNAMASYIGMAEYKLAYDPLTNYYRKLETTIRGSADTINAKNASGFIEWVKDWTDGMSGKSDHVIDRGVQKILSRQTLNSLNNLNKRVRANKVMGNIRTMIVQASNLPNAMSYVTSPKAWAQGIQMLADYHHNPDSEIAKARGQSQFMTQRYGSNAMEILESDGLSAKKLAGKGMELLQHWGDELTWFSAFAQYNENPQAAMSGMKRTYDNAIDYADDITRRSVAGRGVGEGALVNNSKVVNLIAPFQTEILNQWNTFFEHVKDLKASPQARARAAAGLAMYEVTAFAFNTLAQAVLGDKVVGLDFIGALVDTITNAINDDDEDEEKDALDYAKELGQASLGTVVDAAPFINIITSFMGDETSKNLFGEHSPTRYGTGNIGIRAAADAMMWGKDTVETLIDMAGGKATAKDLDWEGGLDAVGNFVTPWGGTQLARTVKGLDTFFRGGKYDKKGNLQYAVAKTPVNFLRAATLGRSILPEHREWVAKGFPSLDEKESKIFQSAKEHGGTVQSFAQYRNQYKDMVAEDDAKNKALYERKEEIKKGNPDLTNAEALERAEIDLGYKEQNSAYKWAKQIADDPNLTNEQKADYITLADFSPATIEDIKSLTDYGVPIDNYVSVISALADKGLKAKDNDLNTDDKKQISKQIFDMQGLTEKQKTALVRKTIGDNWIADFSGKAAFSIANDYGKSEYKKYAKAKEETGITAEQYVELKDKIKNKAFKGTDENGKTVYYLKQCKLANYVDSLDASEEVKKYIWDSVYSDDDDREYEDRHKKLVYRDGEWYTPSGKN